MRYSKINKYDASNWDGISTTIFFTGCTFGCPECFNIDIQDFESGDILTEDLIDEFVTHAKSKHVTDVCILGGEPFQQDLDELYSFISRLKNEVSKPIHVWTGFTYEALLENKQRRDILQLVDTLVDGIFITSLKDSRLKYRGSSNQRVIDVNASMLFNDITLIDCD